MTTITINIPSMTQNVHHLLLVAIAVAGAAATWAQVDGPGLGISAQYITDISLGSVVIATLGRRLLNTPQPPPLTTAPPSVANLPAPPPAA